MGNENGVWIMHGLTEDDPNCIHTADELIDYINQVGFLPLFKNEIDGFSVEEHTESGYWWSGDILRDPWEWRAIIARSGKVAYGKFFDKKAGFISLEWLPYFANHRRDGYDFDALWDDEKASVRQKKIMDELSVGKPVFSNALKERAGFSAGGEKNFEGVISDLQMHTYICVSDFEQRKNKKGGPYGWAIAVYTRPEDLWGRECITSAYGETPEKSFERIKARMKGLYPAVTEKQLKRL